MLLRRVAIAVFAAAIGLVVACGHQVTPNPSNSDLSGDIVLKFRVNGTLDFTDYTYAVVIDTCGEGTPYPQAFQTTFNSYSYAFFIGGAFGTALPQLIQYFVIPNSSATIQTFKVPENSSLEQFLPNDNGQGNEFELIFKRAELNNPSGQTNIQLCANIPVTSTSASPTASAGSSPTATPTAVASTGASAAPSASPTPGPGTTPFGGVPTTLAQQTWAFNFFTIQGTGTNATILDSLGVGGPTDNTYSLGMINTSTTNDVPIFKATGGTEPSNPAAQLSGGDIQNYQ